MKAPENISGAPEIERPDDDLPPATETAEENTEDWLIAPHYVFYAHGVKVGTLPKEEYDDILRTVRRSPLVYLLQAVDVVSGLVLSYTKALLLSPAIMIAFFFAILWFDPHTAASLIDIVRLSPSDELVGYARTGLVYCFGISAMAMILGGLIGLPAQGQFLGIQNRFRWVAHLKVKSVLGVAVRGNLDCHYVSARVKNRD